MGAEVEQVHPCRADVASASRAVAANWRRFWKNRMRGCRRHPRPRLNLGDGPQRKQRVSPKLEELVIGANPIDLQQFLPDLGDELFQRPGLEARIRRPHRRELLNGSGKARTSILPFGVSGRRIERDECRTAPCNRARFFLICRRASVAVRSLAR